MTVNDALIRAEKFKDSKSRLDAYPLTHMEADYLFLAAEVRRLRAMLEPTLDARGIVIRAASIANDYIQDLGDQSRSSEILGRSVQKAILNSQELDSYIAAYRVRLLDEAAERIFTSDKRFPHYHQEGEFTICIPVDDACAAVRGEVEK